MLLCNTSSPLILECAVHYCWACTRKYYTAERRLQFITIVRNYSFKKFLSINFHLGHVKANIEFQWAGGRVGFEKSFSCQA